MTEFKKFYAISYNDDEGDDNYGEIEMFLLKGRIRGEYIILDNSSEKLVTISKLAIDKFNKVDLTVGYKFWCFSLYLEDAKSIMLRYIEKEVFSREEKYEKDINRLSDALIKISDSERVSKNKEELSDPCYLNL
jgi:hypothetical protein